MIFLAFLVFCGVAVEMRAGLPPRGLAMFSGQGQYVIMLSGLGQYVTRLSGQDQYVIMLSGRGQ